MVLQELWDACRSSNGVGIRNSMYRLFRWSFVDPMKSICVEDGSIADDGELRQEYSFTTEVRIHEWTDMNVLIPQCWQSPKEYDEDDKGDQGNKYDHLHHKLHVAV